MRIHDLRVGIISNQVVTRSKGDGRGVQDRRGRSFYSEFPVTRVTSRGAPLLNPFYQFTILFTPKITFFPVFWPSFSIAFDSKGYHKQAGNKTWRHRPDRQSGGEVRLALDILTAVLSFRRSVGTRPGARNAGAGASRRSMTGSQRREEEPKLRGQRKSTTRKIMYERVKRVEQPTGWKRSWKCDRLRLRFYWEKQIIHLNKQFGWKVIQVPLQFRFFFPRDEFLFFVRNGKWDLFEMGSKWL